MFANFDLKSTPSGTNSSWDWDNILSSKGKVVPSLKPISPLLSQVHLRKPSLKVPMRHLPGSSHSQGVKEQVEFHMGAGGGHFNIS